MFRSSYLFTVALLACTLFTTGASADTYAAWKARVFSAQEQANPAISGEQANPAGDGIINLMKYALALDPHQNSVAGLPKVTNDGSHLFLTYRSAYDTPGDLHIFPEVSPDLKNWHRGQTATMYSGYDYDADGTLLLRYNAVSPMPDNQRLFMRLTVLEGDVLPEAWQLQYFGHTGVMSTADADGDGLSNFEEYLNEYDPTDIYNPTPYLTVYSGNLQGGPINQFLPQPLVVQVTNLHGQPMLNAPVHFAVNSGGGKLSLATANQSLVDALDLQTNASGQARVFYQQGTSAPVLSEVYAQATNNGHVSAQQSFTCSTANPPTIILLSPQAGSTVGTSQVNVSVQVNSDAKLDEVRINSILVEPADQSGHYLQSLTLPEGTQNIVVSAKSIYGMVSSQSFPIMVDSKAPNLTILSPMDKQVFTTQNVFVQTHADSNQVSVAINGSAAFRNGYNFSAWVPLNPGANTIIATLTDSAGRHNTDSVAVHYNPPRGGSADRDGDGVPDSQDLFPDDRNNCADSDRDGVGDNDDPNPNDPNIKGPVYITSPEEGLVIQSE